MILSKSSNLIFLPFADYKLSLLYAYKVKLIEAFLQGRHLDFVESGQDSLEGDLPVSAFVPCNAVLQSALHEVADNTESVLFCFGNISFSLCSLGLSLLA